MFYINFPKGKRVGFDSFVNADLRGANLRGLHFSGVDFAGADFLGADLRYTHMVKCNFHHAFLDTTWLDYAYFYKCVFTMAVTKAAILEHAAFFKCSGNAKDIRHLKLPKMHITWTRHEIFIDDDTRVTVQCAMQTAAKATLHPELIINKIKYHKRIITAYQAITACDGFRRFYYD